MQCDCSCSAFPSISSPAAALTAPTRIQRLERAWPGSSSPFPELQHMGGIRPHFCWSGTFSSAISACRTLTRPHISSRNISAVLKMPLTFCCPHHWLVIGKKRAEWDLIGDLWHERIQQCTGRKGKKEGEKIKEKVLGTSSASHARIWLRKYKKPYVSYSNCPLHPSLRRGDSNEVLLHIKLASLSATIN